MKDEGTRLEREMFVGLGSNRVFGFEGGEKVAWRWGAEGRAEMKNDIKMNELKNEKWMFMKPRVYV